MAILSYGGVYKNKLLNLHETALNINVVIFVLWSFFNYSGNGSKTKQQQVTAYTMISIFYVLFAAVLIYHISKKLKDLGIPQYLFHLLRRQGEIANGGEIELRERQGSG